MKYSVFRLVSTPCAPLAAVGILVLASPAPGAAEPSRAPVEARFRGCDDSRSCRFLVDAGPAPAETSYRVMPDGVDWRDARPEQARAVRDRLNALLSSMIHQHKRVELFGLRPLEDGRHAARVVVNGADVAIDPQLSALAAGDPP